MKKRKTSISMTSNGEKMPYYGLFRIAVQHFALRRLLSFHNTIPFTYTAIVAI